MSLIHDLAEVYVSDLPPSSISGVSKIDKERLEEEAMRRICGQGKKEWGEVWKEYEEGETKCARLVKDVDLLEMYIQGYEYEIMNEEVELGEFFEGERLWGGEGREDTGTVMFFKKDGGDVYFLTPVLIHNFRH